MTREKFIDFTKDHIIYLDGATGSNLVRRNALRSLPGAVDSGT